MKMEIGEISGIGEYIEKREKNRLLFEVKEKVFLVENLGSDQGELKTIEVRTDQKLKNVLMERYETVMESRYFGRGGIEIVPSGQLSDGEIADLVRLSYNLTMEMA